jgi:heme-degrading monooxygenase HmoA
MRKLPGFLRASFLRRILPEGVEYVVVTEWANLEAIRQFAGNNVERAVVPAGRSRDDARIRSSRAPLRDHRVVTSAETFQLSGRVDTGAALKQAADEGDLRVLRRL